MSESDPMGRDDDTHFVLDKEALLAAATRDLQDGPVTPGFGPWRAGIVRLLNDALATELVCVLRYKRHHFTAKGLVSPSIAQEFMVHAQAEAGHADLLAERIVQLGGEPDFNPDTLTQRSHAQYDGCAKLLDMLRANLVAERVAVESYRQMIHLVGDKDPTTRRILEQILADEEEHAEELADWLSSESGKLIGEGRQSPPAQA
ncbi:MAG: ferritin-like domain-containing protein [Acidobacteriota bacterium]